MELTGPSDNGMKQKILITGGSGTLDLFWLRNYSSVIST